MIKREIPIFLVVGGLTVLVDFCVYRGLVWTQWFGVDSAKAIGFLAGTVFAYFANKRWTFAHHTHAAGSVWRFILVYLLSLGANVAVNALWLNYWVGITSVVLIAFLVATGVSATLNFLGMKFFVFKAVKRVVK